MSATDSFVALVSRLEQSDAAATAEVWRRYVHRLAGIALQHLPPSLRAKTDVDDILQSTFLSFVQGFRAGRFAVPDWASLEGLLILITLRKGRIPILPRRFPLRRCGLGHLEATGSA